jgi:hypothetical protein
VASFRKIQRSEPSDKNEQPKGGFVTNYIIVTSASLYKKANDLDHQALNATSPGQAAIFRRVANLKRVAAGLIKITEVAG